MVQNSQLKSRVTAKPASIPSSQYAKLTSERENEIHRRLDTLIDPRKPLLDQVKYLSREEFLVYVSRPRSLATKEAENDIILYSDEKLNLATTSNVYHNALGLSLVDRSVFLFGLQRMPEWGGLHGWVCLVLPAHVSLVHDGVSRTPLHAAYGRQST